MHIGYNNCKFQIPLLHWEQSPVTISDINKNYIPSLNSFTLSDWSILTLSRCNKLFARLIPETRENQKQNQRKGKKNKLKRKKNNNNLHLPHIYQTRFPMTVNGLNGRLIELDYRNNISCAHNYY